MCPVSRTLLGLGVRYNWGLLAPLPYGVHFLRIYVAWRAAFGEPLPIGAGENDARYVGFRELWAM